MHSGTGIGVVDRRRLFRADRANAVAEAAVGCPVEPVTGRGRLSERLCWFVAPGKLVVVAGPYRDPRDTDLALAHGLRYVAPDQVLVLVLPRAEEAARATRARAPWISVPMELYTYDLPAIERGEPVDVAPCPPMEPSQVLQQYRTPEPAGWGYGIESPQRPAEYAEMLGDKASWVAGLTAWLAEQDELAEGHTNQHLAWRCDGTIVLKMTVGRKLTISAGIQYSRSGRPPLTVACSDVLPDSEVKNVQGRVRAAIDEVRGGLAERYREHQLQGAIVRQGPQVLGLIHPLKAERAAWRPYPQGRAFLDFLGVDANGVLHIVETKVGADAMMVLQGLDYWIWVTANKEALAAEFELQKVTGVEVDFLIDEGKGSSLGRYSKSQSNALEDEVIHRFWTIGGWENGRVPEINPLVPA
jgi:hypothetical protein